MPVFLQEIEEDRQHAEEVSSDLPLSRRKTSAVSSKIRRAICIFLKCIVMGFVFSLSLIFIGFAALVLVHFFVTSTASGWRRRHRGDLRQDHPQSSSMDSTSRSYSREDLQQLLPPLSYVESPYTSMDCSICLENLQGGDFCRKLPDCKHLFHVNCIDNWLTMVPNCPICRTRVQLDSVASGSVHRDDEWKVRLPVAASEDGNVSI